MSSTELQKIDELITRFYACFDNRGDRVVTIAELKPLFAPAAQIIKCVNGEFERYDFESFAEPRVQLLNSGDLKEFFEYETTAKTDCMGHIAQRWSRYEKQWLEDEQIEKGQGVKSIQLCASDGNWTIASILWDDL